MKILFLQKRLILPADTGGKIRTCNVVEHLAKWHEFTYLCNLLEQERRWLEKMVQLGLRLETIPWREPPRRSFAFAAQAIRNLALPYPLNEDKNYDSLQRRRAKQLLKSEPYELLDCSPNIDGVEHFVRQIWPNVPRRPQRDIRDYRS